MDDDNIKDDEAIYYAGQEEMRFFLMIEAMMNLWMTASDLMKISTMLTA